MIGYPDIETKITLVIITLLTNIEYPILFWKMTSVYHRFCSWQLPTLPVWTFDVIREEKYDGDDDDDGGGYDETSLSHLAVNYERK